MPNMNSVDHKLRDEYVLLEVDKYKVSVSLTLDSKVISATWDHWVFYTISKLFTVSKLTLSKYQKRMRITSYRQVLSILSGLDFRPKGQSQRTL